MDQEEVIARLKEHLEGRKRKQGRLCRNDKFYCTYYVEDFLFLKKKEAIAFVKKYFPEIADFK